MDPEVARWAVLAITAVGSAAWVGGLGSMIRATRERRESADLAATRFSIEAPPSAGVLVGEAEVEGRPEELSNKLAGLLARDGMGPFGPSKILSCDREEIRFEPTGVLNNSYRAGRIRLTPVGLRTRIDYLIEAGSRGLLIGGWVMVGAGLVALTVGPWLALTFAVPSPTPAIRAQSFQVVQMIHFLWPPFLFAYLSRQTTRALRGRIETLIHNLPYT